MWQSVWQPLKPPGVANVQSAMRPYSTSLGLAYAFFIHFPPRVTDEISCSGAGVESKFTATARGHL